jgi:basic amino acid/polyamine antiporter, APA family
MTDNSNNNINNLEQKQNTKLENQKYARNLSFSDLFFAGYGFIVGAGIFSLLPYIIKYGQGLSWFSFVVGGIICLITGLSYAKLNSLYPSNDAEYSWIMNVLNFNKDKDPEKTSKFVKFLSAAIIWIVVLIGLFTAATVLVGQADIIRLYLNYSKPKIIALMIAFPTLIVMAGNKSSTALNKLIMALVTVAFALLYGQASSKGTNFRQVDFNLGDLNMEGVLKSSFITIFAYNGFQSIVQLSEEANDKGDIPKSILSSVSFSTLIYGLITISVISLIGLKTSSNSVSPLADAYGVFFGKKGTDVVNLLALAALTNTILIITLSRSRLIQKLAVRGILPKFLAKLTSIGEFLGLEKFTGTNESKKKTIPINSIITLSLVTYLITFIRKGAIEYLASLTSSFIFIVFTLVNSLVIINYYKKKTDDEIAKEKEVDKTLPMIKGFPWYAVVGFVISVSYLNLSRKYLKLIK